MIVVLFLLICIRADTIPNDGKFFYSILTMGLTSDGVNDVNTMYMPTLISSNPDWQSFRLGFKTDQPGINVFSSSCGSSNCAVTMTYNETQSESVEASDLPYSSTIVKEVHGQTFGLNISMFVEYKEELFKLQMGNVSFRETNFTNFTFGIMDFAKNNYYSPVLDGFIGIAPYVSGDVNVGKSLMNQLITTKKITNFVVMLDVDLAMGNNTIIKFGGYDSNQIDGDINIFPTNDQWQMSTFRTYFGSSQFNRFPQLIQFTPEYPFMYLNPDDFEDMKTKLKAQFGTSIDCESVACKFENMKCYDVYTKFDSGSTHQLEFTIPSTVSGQYQKINLPFKTILAQGDRIGYSEADCYVSIFNSQETDTKWYLGTQALQELVLIYYQDSAYKTYLGVAKSQPKDEQFNYLKQHYYRNGEFTQNDDTTWQSQDASYIQGAFPQPKPSPTPTPPAPVPPGPTPDPKPDTPSAGKPPFNVTYIIIGAIVIAVIIAFIVYCRCYRTRDNQKKLKTNSNFDGVSNLFGDNQRPMKTLLQ